MKQPKLSRRVSCDEQWQERYNRDPDGKVKENAD